MQVSGRSRKGKKARTDNANDLIANVERGGGPPMRLGGDASVVSRVEAAGRGVEAAPTSNNHH